MSTREIVIAGVTVTVSTPYAEGHALTAAEAKALNQTRCENISNAMRKRLNDMAVEGVIPADAAQAAVAEYDAAYEFTLSGAGGGGRRPTDPLEKECFAIARAEVTRQIKAQGLKVKDVDPEVIEVNVAAFAESEQVIKLAKKRLKERAELGLSLSLA
jgi:hypothetical protein